MHLKMDDIFLLSGQNMRISGLGGDYNLLTKTLYPSSIVIKWSLGTGADCPAENFLAFPACRCGRKAMVSPKPREQK